MDENLTEQSLTDAPSAEAPVGEPAATSVSIKDVLAQRLGKTFPTDEAALKSVEDTFAYVGKQKSQPAVDPSQFVSRSEFEEATFFAAHPELNAYKPLISSVGKAAGKPLAEVIEMPDVKSVIEKARAHDEYEQSKSVLQTNPRLGQITDKMSQAREAAAAGNSEVARSSAVDAVIDAFELRG